MPGNTVETRFRTRGTDAMERQLRGVEKQLKDIANAGKNLKDGLSRASVGIGLAIAGFEAMKVAAQAVTTAVGGLVSVMRTLSQRGGDVSSIVSEFSRVGSPGVRANLEAFTAGMSNSTNIMQRYNTIVSAGILTSEQAVQGLGLVAARARQTGRPLEQMLDAFEAAATGRGAEAFGRLGVAVSAVTNEVTRMGVSSESAAGKQEVLRRIMVQFGESLDGTSIASGHTEDALQEIIVVYENMRDEVARVFAENEQLRDTLIAIAAQLRPLIPMAVRFGVILAEMAEIMLQMAIEAAPGVARAFQGVLRVFEVAIQATSDWVSLLGGRNDQLNRMVDNVARLRGAIGDLGTAFVNAGRDARTFGESVPPMLSADAFATQDTAAIRAARRGGGRRRETPTERLMGEDVSQAGLFDEIISSQDEIESARHATRMERLNELKNVETELADKRRLEQEELMNAELAQGERIKEQQQAIAEKAEEARGRVQSFISMGADLAASGAGFLQTLGGAFGQMAAAKQQDIERTKQAMREMGRTEAEIEAATKDREKSVKRLQKAEAGFLVAYNIAMAAVEVARAIGSYPDIAGIVAHGLAAAAYGVAAGIAASKLGGGGGGGGAPTVPSVETFTPAEDRGIPTAEAEGPRQTNVVNYYSLGRSGEDLGRALRTAEFEYERSDGRAVGGMGVSYS